MSLSDNMTMIFDDQRCPKPVTTLIYNIRQNMAKKTGVKFVACKASKDECFRNHSIISAYLTCIRKRSSRISSGRRWWVLQETRENQPRSHAWGAAAPRLLGSDPLASRQMCRCSCSWKEFVNILPMFFSVSLRPNFHDRMSLLKAIMYQLSGRIFFEIH